MTAIVILQSYELASKRLRRFFDGSSYTAQHVIVAVLNAVSVDSPRGHRIDRATLCSGGATLPTVLLESVPWCREDYAGQTDIASVKHTGGGPFGLPPAMMATDRRK
jgi:hypothetical protein